MDIQALFRQKSRFVVRDMGDELILVPLTGNVAQMNEMFTLNETGKFIWENLAESATLDSLENHMTTEFDIDTETARTDIVKFLEQLEVLFKNNGAV